MNNASIQKRGLIISIAIAVALAFVFAASSARAEELPIPDTFDPGVPIPILACELEVIKTVEGGTAVPSDFSVHVLRNGIDIPGSPHPGSWTGTFYFNLAPGFYRVTETGGPPGYTAIFSGACDAQGNIGLTLDTKAVCYIKNVFTGATTTPPNNPPPAATSTSSGGGSLSGTVVAPGIPDTGIDDTLDGDVVAPWTLTGEVIAPSSGGGSSGGGSSGGGGGNGPIVGSLPSGGGGGGSPPGQVLGAATAPPVETPAVGGGDAPAVPNTGAGGTAFPLLALSGLIAILGIVALVRARHF